MKKCFVIMLVLYSICYKSVAGQADTITVFSTSMQKNMACVVIVPDAYKKSKQSYPVLYLLHGFSGKYSDWIRKVPDIKKHADKFNMIIVCPDGAYACAYIDSRVDSNYRYETHVAKEIPAYIDKHYRTISNRNGRAITGLSMGGHGALSLGLKYTDFYGACGSMSGAVNLDYLKGRDEFLKIIGDTITHASEWQKHSVIRMVDNPVKNKMAIIFDCGIDDFLYQPNVVLHEKLKRLNVAHDYIERPGAHNWEYWANALPYQLMFFRNFFDQQSGSH